MVVAAVTMLNRQKLSPTLLEDVRALIADQLGLNFSVEREPELEQSLSLLAVKFGHQGAADCAKWLIHSSLTPEQIETLAGCLTTGETYFFRERTVFSHLEKDILPALFEERRNRDRRLRIWSAACSSGEEPYSIAVLLDRLLPDREEWDITILATDINPIALEKARRGIYHEWSFRQAPPWLKQRYFIARESGDYEIRANLKSQVSFEQLNLANDIYPSASNNTYTLDLIFCRNVMMYLTPECARHTVERLYRCLKNDGWLIVGQTELSPTLFSALTPVHYSDAVIYRRANLSTEPVYAALQRLQPEYKLELSVKESPAVAVPSILPGEEVSPIPGETPADYGLAVSCFQLGRYMQAESGLLQLLATEPEETEALSLLARCIAKQGRLAEARRWCEQAIAANQLDPTLHYLLADIDAWRGAKEDAAAALRCALFLDPGFVMAHFAWGQLAEENDQADEAAKHFANARRLLQARPPAELVAEGDGLTVGCLMNIINRKQFENAEDY